MDKISELNKMDKELLLQDLCARLFYGVKIWYKYYPINVTSKFATSLRLVDNKIALSSKFNKEGDWYPIEEAEEILIKPYLRSMSSMTEEEKEELKNLFDAEEVTNDSICYLEGGTLVEYLSDISYSFCSKIINWLNAHHFDYRGLIQRGLAIEVTKENNPYV